MGKVSTRGLRSERTSPKVFVFVLMPFSQQFDDVYQLGIKPACSDAGAYCERVDEQNFDESILQRVYNQISKADVIVADMTGRNPNVFYETGYAHALNKRVVLLTQNAEDIPFDLKHYPHIIYGGKITNLKTQLESRIRWCIENPKESLSKADVNLEFIVNGVILEGNSEISIRSGSTFPLKINIHNLSNRVLYPDSYSLSLILSDEHTTSDSPFTSKTRLPDGRSVCNLAFQVTLFPDSWSNIEVPIFIPTSFTSRGRIDVLLRVYTELGVKDYPFFLVPRG